MCGICGFSGSFEPCHVAAMNQSLAHRGPDGSGVFFDAEANIGLGHRRLAIIDPSDAGQQPMANEDGTVQVVFNGEIYNFQELRRDLVRSGHRFRSATDTETIVHLYEEVGIEVVKSLKGIFALAIWDVKKRELLLARDHLGVKPLYYAELPRGVAFASELKALLVFRELPRRLDFQTIHQHLCFVWSAGPATMFRDVRKLEPGMRMVVRDGKIVRHESFFDLPYEGEPLKDSWLTQTHSIHDLLRNAVQRQMVSDVPVGAFLSGGVDSSAIVAMMKSATGQQFKCYTVDFGQNRVDANEADLPYARQTAAHLGVELCEVRVKPCTADQIERMVFLLDEPQADPACLNVSLICEQARKDGVYVLLSGAGGDDIFSGYRRHTALLWSRYFDLLPGWSRKRIRQIGERLPHTNPLLTRLRKALQYVDCVPEVRIASAFLWADQSRIRNLYSPGVKSELLHYDAAGELFETLRRIPRETNQLNRMLYLEAKHFLPDHNLNYTDKMSMAHGVEVRVPFLDLDLVDYAIRLPASSKARYFDTKRILKHAMKGVLPQAVLRRPKAGFGAPLQQWIRGELRPLVGDMLSEASVRSRGLFDASAVQKLIADNNSGRENAAYTIFSLVCIESWLRRFVDHGGPTGATTD